MHTAKNNHNKYFAIVACSFIEFNEGSIKFTTSTMLISENAPGQIHL